MEHQSIFTIFGGTGNLTFNKLMPAFYQIFLEKKISTKVSIVAIGRREITREEYINRVEAKIKKKVKQYTQESFQIFKQSIHYYKMDFSNSLEYSILHEFIDSIDKNHHGNRIFYLATAPRFFGEISKYLKENDVLITDGFIRSAFEKPFGYDLESAKEINDQISEVFGENNIYRIDHYLGKEMIQNIIMVRFTNQVFRSVWNNEAIDNIQITVNESNGVEERGGYYDHAGALRDMVQNHLLQILAFVAMEKPEYFNTNHIRNEKVKVLEKLVIKNDTDIIFGQYKGYQQEAKVDPNSTTETFVALKCEVDLPRWKGVPFYLRTGKNLKNREAQVIIEFKNEYCCELFEKAEPNLLIIKIQPEEGIYFRINTKKPRTESSLMPVTMDYCQSCNIAYNSPEAYERLLLDIIKGDSTLFTRWDEVDSAWRFIKRCNDGKITLSEYEPNGYGPKEAQELLQKDGRKWWNLEEINQFIF